MLRGHVFKFQTFANEAFAHFINTFLQGNMGVTKGCNLSKTNDSVTIGAGYFCVMGRFLEIIGNETISDISNTGYYQLICEIDLSKTNTSSELNQAVIKLIRNTSGYATLTKEDLFDGGNVYQYEFARFKVTETGITEFTDRRTFLSITSLYSQINSNFNTLFEAKDEEAESLLEEIREELANVIDGSAYLLKEGGTMTGDLAMNDSVIKIASGITKGIQNSSDKPIIRDHGSGNVTVDATDDTLFLGFDNTQRINCFRGKVTVETDGGIYWKENGYGDKFKIVPEFSGADDNNLLKIQGAVGGAGEDPTLQDLVNITAKNGNVNVKGTLEADNYRGKLYGYNWDIGTENTVDTWLLVMNGDKIQHRAINTILPAMAIVTGTITMPEAGSETISGITEVSYPSGFTSQNSVIISLMSHNTAYGDDTWATNLRATSVTSTMYGNGDLYAVLMSNKIRVSSNKNDTAMPRKDIKFKLVLMKIS